ncbi:MAG: 16S rRNA (guanine(527)-N(7))-methyltransferase RsmG [Firmicutes bacterium]|nr:16S rRNA (guanine(527)-N(7))-methyltransferase RsmG [Bacillota bacterium]
MLSSGAAALGIALESGHLAAFEAYRREILEWNQRINLTAITGDEEIAVKHFVDSIACLKAAEIPPRARLVDVGSGAGFPGIPLAILRPDLDLWLLDATRKKVEFLRHVTAALGIAAHTVWARAEDAGQRKDLRERFDVATARAVAPLGILAEYCLPLCRVGGRVLAMKGRYASAEVGAAMRAVRLLGGRVESVYEYELPFGAGTRAIPVIVKDKPTPRAYPRNAGTPAKKPL